MIPRMLRRAFAVALAAVSVTLGMVILVDTLAAVVGDSPVILPWDGWYDKITVWAADGAFWTGAALAAAGLMLVALALWPPRRARLVALEGASRRLQWYVPADNLEDKLARAAGRVAGVRRARARYGDGAVHVQVRAARSDTAHVQEAVRANVLEARDGIPLRTPLSVGVHVSPTK